MIADRKKNIKTVLNNCNLVNNVVSNITVSQILRGDLDLDSVLDSDLGTFSLFIIAKS